MIFAFTTGEIIEDIFFIDLRDDYETFKAYSGTLTRREIVRANASLGELRRDKEKLSSPISCELRRDKASQGELRENGQPNVEVIRVNTYIML